MAAATIEAPKPAPTVEPIPPQPARLNRPVSVLSRAVPPSRVVVKLDAGTRVIVNGRRSDGLDDWRHIRVDDEYHGWVPTAALEPAAP